MNIQVTASDEYRRRWGRITKRQNLHHPKRQARYDRAMARITTERREAITARALKELGMVKYPTGVNDILRADALIAHKLGEYVPVSA